MASLTHVLYVPLRVGQFQSSLLHTPLLFELVHGEVHLVPGNAKNTSFLRWYASGLHELPTLEVIRPGHQVDGHQWTRQDHHRLETTQPE